jgi:murein hydrolase activator
LPELRLKASLALLVVAVVMLASRQMLSAEDDAQQRERLRRQVEQLTAELQLAHKARDKHSRELAGVEVKFSDLSAKLHHTEQQSSEVSASLQELMVELEPIEKRIATQRELLKQQVRTSFLMGRQQQLRMLLSMDDPTRVSRMAAYYSYLMRARADVIRDVRRTHYQLLETGARIRAEEQRLQALKTEQSQLLQSLQVMREARRVAVERWNEKIRNTDERLAIVREDMRQLERLAERLKESVEQVAEDRGQPQAARQPEPFTSGLGKLQWPLSGKLLQRFGESVVDDVRLKGMVISAAAGSEVRAVYPGEVVFADWLRGYGLMIIIDHGEGYMTLYGYNQSLLKSVGDKVKGGEVISLSGESGGQQQPALYFAIRRGAESFDPLRWCVRVAGNTVG